MQGGGDSTIVLDVIRAHDPGLLVKLNVQINSIQFMDILDKRCVNYFDGLAESGPIFMQDEVVTHTAGNVKRII